LNILPLGMSSHRNFSSHRNEISDITIPKKQENVI
jgi:hypothetical protein